MSKTVLLLLDEEVRPLVAEHTGAEFASEWNRDGLRARVAALVPRLESAAAEVIDAAVESGRLTEELADMVSQAYEQKRTEIGPEAMLVLERLVLLRVIDSLWVEHLTAVDDMRRGIGLRAYSQRDPLDEFKREAFGMFEELKTTIRHDITHTIFRVTVTREPSAARPQRMLESRPDMATGATSATAAALASSPGGGPPQPAKGGPKLGRNDPCWCGSGKKFKRCHGA